MEPISVLPARLPGDSAAAKKPTRDTLVTSGTRRSRPPPPANADGAPCPRTFGALSAHSAAMGAVFDLVERFATTDVTVLFAGETGAGKDVLAHALHAHSARASGPFVLFDCGAVAANLTESELFGHERGAFTGALTLHEGAFERAHGGTLFLDEIGELPLDLQPRLLRVLESRRVRRVGGTQDRAFDVRIVAATNRDLRREVAAGRFRQDLYFRLAGAEVPVPPLRERLDDLPFLVERLLSEMGRAALRVAPATLDALLAHPWPGNVRELKNALVWAAAFVDDDEALIEPRHLRLRGALPPEPETSDIDRLALAGRRLDLLERAAIRQTMTYADNNKVHAARALGISVSTLYEKLKKYDL
jgi:DNA-binding NtrC family response regulator